MKKKLTDAQIMKQRGKLYGDADLMWKAIGRLHRTLDDYYREIHGNTVPDDEFEAHLACLKEALVKVVRSVATPEHQDNYCDGRNYLTIAGDCINGN